MVIAWLEAVVVQVVTKAPWGISRGRPSAMFLLWLSELGWPGAGSATGERTVRSSASIPAC